MKRFFSWQVMLGVILILLSTIFYLVHYAIFRDAHHIFIYLIGDVAFAFLEVLLVTLIIHQLLTYREKKTMLKKLNMVIGVFFSEVGYDLIKIFATFDLGFKDVAKSLIVSNQWSEKKFISMSDDLLNYNCSIDSTKGDLDALKGFLKEKRDFLLTLLENPNLLEHETFSNLLWAVFHITEELVHRTALNDKPESDCEHLSGDIKRAYQLLIIEWLVYMQHLKSDYPYLFSLAVRTNPFDPQAQVEVN
ncbi:MAG: hypothetical protein P9M13_08615 [Candidatus Ancaeobacter aquaticus]|nr:hypothetical protein [Candidatus Ancaeobacter aquaticus]